LKTNKRPLFLVSNDDGIYANGLAALVEVVKKHGDVVVVAPDKGNSAKSHAVTLDQPIYYTFIRQDENVRYYSCSGTPVDCVKIAVNKIMDIKPDFVVSGINHGSNASINVIYSGTMGAAIEGCILGIPSIGFSITDHSHEADLSAAKHYCNEILEQMIDWPLSQGTCLNVNIPSIPLEQMKGVKVCRQTKGFWSEDFFERMHPHGKKYFWLTGEYLNCEPGAQDTDEWALKNGYIAVVPVQVDLTAYSELDQLKTFFHGK